ncbi:transporter substrate-binding domain-containing protein [Fodinisporobacter ferrooxydans]|uniref:Transporter substrate-binding domain-containing protein n=1 Tax=Fodinisporobacter ferrooxydans TaxID=2901836 RepID=A0ABY4CP39_9BACL|nr:transporter substrate-binding domain-containing protein [Alicyclobacillaceae bacterium MYW30-H2]
MKRVNILATLAITSLFATSILAGCGSSGSAGNDQGKPQLSNSGSAAASKPHLIMATSADYPPYEFHDLKNNNKISGFDIDIANAIAKQLNFDFEIKDMDFNGLIPALQAKRADFVMAGMTPKPERLKNADFSIIYYEAKNTIVARKDSNITKPEDLAGKKVGVQLGSIQEGDAKDLAKKEKGMQVVPLNKVPDIIQELKSNRIDAAIIEDTVAKGYTDANKDLMFTTIPTTGPSGSAVAFPKGSKWVDKFNSVLKKMKADGEIDALVKKWFEKK